MAEQLLQVQSLNVFYGQAHTLQDVSLTVGTAPVALVGRNGMGKTTLCKALMGLVPVASGDIRLEGTALTGRKPFQVAAAGIGYVPQGRRIFPSLSVHEHLQLMAGGQRKSRNKPRWTIETVYELFPRLFERRKVGAASLSGGEQQMLAIGRALMLNAPLLLMDEPSEGLAPVVIDQLVQTLKKLSAEGIGMLVVEQKLSVATAIADRLLVMVGGRIALETTSTALLADEEAQQHYLGVG